MIPVETPIRKACNRCHSQKLSCKRVADEPCERCLRLRVECKSSPSLRHRKQQGLPSASRSTSPKRLRISSGGAPVTGSTLDSIVASPTQHGLHGEGFRSTTGPSMDMVDYTFGFDNVYSFPQSHMGSQLSHPQVPKPLESFGALRSQSDDWNPQFSSGSTADNNSRLKASMLQDAIPLPRLAQDYSSKKQSPRLQSEESNSRRIPRPNKQRIMLTRTPSRGPLTASQWMLQSSELNSKLLGLSALLPGQPELSSPITAGGGNTPREATDLHERPTFAVDEMFQLSKKFVELIKDLCPPKDLPQESGEIESPIEAYIDPRSDPGSSLFVLSTYVRLLDMYQKVFSFLQSELSNLDSATSLTLWRLPEIVVGSFQIISPLSLQMWLAVQLAEDFLSQLRETTAALDRSLQEDIPVPEGASKAENMFSPVFKVSYQAVKTQEEALGKQLAELEKELESMTRT